MTVKVTTTYETSDGKKFGNSHDAEVHEAALAIHSWVQSHSICAEGITWRPRHVADVILKDWRTLYARLKAFVDLEEKVRQANSEGR